MLKTPIEENLTLKPVYEWMGKTDMNDSDDQIKPTKGTSKESSLGKKPLKTKVKPKTKTKQVKCTKKSQQTTTSTLLLNS